MKISTNLYPNIFPRINISEIDIVEDAAGPGRRMVFWMQGCLKRCPGCANGPFLTKKENQLFSTDQLLDKIQAHPNIEGISLSGGEPLLQAKALLPFLDEVHKRGLNILSYSGYTLEELQMQKEDTIDLFLNHLDILIDGEYQQEIPRAGIYQPSGNQRVHYLSNRMEKEPNKEIIETVFSVSGNDVAITGTLPMEVRKTFFKLLLEEGVKMEKKSKPL